MLCRALRTPGKELGTPIITHKFTFVKEKNNERLQHYCRGCRKAYGSITPVHPRRLAEEEPSFRKRGIYQKAIFSAIDHILKDKHAVLIAVIIKELGLYLDMLA